MAPPAPSAGRAPVPRRSARARAARLTVVVVVLLLAAVIGAVAYSAAPSGDGRPAADGTSRARASELRLPVEDQFVRRSGSTLELDGKPWRFAGVNMYWLGLDENVTDAHGPTYPTHAAVDSAFAAARRLGVTLVRSNTLGISVGSPRSLEPALGRFNNAAFASIDYAVAAARRYGLRLMIPLVDEWHYYEGGEHTFTNWLGYRDLPGQSVVTNPQQRAKEQHFYTDPRVIAAFHAYVAYLLDHVNPLTGLRLGHDPTVAVWETGNEVWNAPPSWTEQTAAYIKSLAPNALVADGSDSEHVAIADTGYAEPDVDIIDGHMYPVDVARARSAASFVAAHGKAYVVGEYGLPGAGTASWLDAVAADPNIAGDAAWSMFPWLPNGKPEQHDDGLTFHYPGATPQEAADDVLLERHAARMSG